ncbi:hypothetical protein CANARDRAFT_28357 [[Candida] arabinofermentans NRRL YB-2248]|uniref:Uncharacterized protein n=1 Tax=[Candida] arabinofermentans NRRL YB-2248 TaxID=983967 RepID=A0A1E4T1G9_9ASCO|nr:hypothetical protein CANARDRAFT_28357 [[Candida] arabinofermentans NRRL YB-2248]
MFSVSRLKSSPSKSTGHVASSVDSIGDSSRALPLLGESDHFKIFKRHSNLPRLKQDEIIFYGNTDDSTKNSILITSEKVLIYSYTSNEVNPASFEFEYLKNDFGILPQVKLIPNTINELQPGLVVVDSITGIVRFVESISLAPSLDILNNEHEMKLRLANGEFVTMTEYFEDIGLVLATNHRKVHVVTFVDQFGKVSLNSTDIQNPKSFLSFFGGGSGYDLERYDDANKIIAIKCLSQSLLRKKLLIQDEDGKFSCFECVKNNTPQLAIQANIKSFLQPFIDQLYSSYNAFKIKDLEPWGDDYLILGCVEVSNQQSALILFRVGIASYDDVKVHSCYQITTITTSEKYPKLHLLNNGSVAAIATNDSIALTDLTTDDTDKRWEDFVNFKSSVNVFGFGLEGNNSINILTGSGIYKVDISSAGSKLTPKLFVKSHIEQALKFEDGSNPLNFNFHNLKSEILSEDIEGAIYQISDDILTNKSAVLAKFSTVDSSLDKKVEVMNNLCQFVSNNFSLGSDLKLLLVNTAEKLNLSKELYHLIGNSELSDILTDIIRDDFNQSLSEFFTESVQSILELISKLILKSIETEEEVTNLVDFSSLLSNLFTSGYVVTEQNIRSKLLNLNYAEVMQIHPLFLDSIHILHEVNRVLKRLASTYSSQLESSVEIELKIKLNEIVLNLSFFLYYSTNNMIQYLSTREPTSEYTELIDNFRSFLDSNKSGWIDIFIISRKQQDIMPLAEFFEDLEGLCQCLESERMLITDIENPIMMINYQNEVEIKFEGYFSKFGYEFAETLFNYYIKTHKINLILTQFHQYQEYLNRFLESSYRTLRFSWILDMNDENYYQVAMKLIKYVSLAKEETVENKKLQLNLAKLSLIALDEDKEEIQICLDEIESKIRLVDLQINYESIVRNLTSGTDESLSIDKLITGSDYLFKNQLTSFQTELYKIITKLTSRIELSLIEIVQLLTLINFDSCNFESFDNLFKLLSILKESFSESPLQSNGKLQNYKVSVLEKLIWKRLLLTTDWTKMLKTYEIPNTNFYKVMTNLTNYQIDKPHSIDSLSTTSDELTLLEIDYSLLDDFKKEDELLSRLNNEVDLQKWLVMKY